MPSNYTLQFAHSPDRRVAQYVVIDVPTCLNSFGFGLCQATGSTPCWYTRNLENDCQSTTDGVSYDYIQKTEEIVFVDIDSDYSYGLPLIRSINTAPSKLPSGGGLANIGKTTIKMADAPYDTFYDPNRMDRGLAVDITGSFWPRFRAKNPFISGSKITIYTAIYPNTDINAYDLLLNPGNAAKQEFLIESISLPDKNGDVTITCKDPLNLTDALKEKLPRPSKGMLLADLAAATTSGTFSVDDASDVGQQVQPKYIRINDEVLEITLSGDVYTIVNRGVLGTVAEDHSTDDAVQEVYYVEPGYYVNTSLTTTPSYTTSTNNHHIADVIDRVTRDSGIASDYRDLTNWAAELDLWRAEYLLTNYITEPKAVSEILRDLAEQCQLNMHYDPFLAKIDVSAKRPVIGARPLLSTAADIYDLTLKEREDLRLTTVSVYSLPRDYTEKSKGKDYRYRQVASETKYVDLYGVSKDTEIKADWLPSTSLATATAANLLNTRKHPPVEITFKMDVKNLRVYDGDQDNISFINSINTGVQFDLEAPQFQKIDGTTKRLTFTCTSVDLEKDGVVKVTASQYAVSTGKVFEISALTTDYDGATTGERAQYGWISADNLLIPTANDPAYEII